MDNVFDALENGDAEPLGEYLEDRIRATYIAEGARGLSNWHECAPHSILTELFFHRRPPGWSYGVEVPADANRYNFADLVVKTADGTKIVVEIKYVPYDQFRDVSIYNGDDEARYEASYEAAYQFVEQAENLLKIWCRKTAVLKVEQWVKTRYVSDKAKMAAHELVHSLEADHAFFIIVVGHRVLVRPLVESFA